MAILAIVSLVASDTATTSPAMSDVALPGGVAAAHRALGDRTSPNAALFLGELVERFYNTPKQTDANQDERLQRFLAYLEQATAAGGPSEALPLPATATWWTENVLARAGTPPTLVLDVLRSRDAALLYRALVSLDSPTREWFTAQPALVRDITRGRAAQLVLASPGIRVNGGRLVTPGGEQASAAWEAFLGTRLDDPVAIVRRLIEQDEGGLAYFYGRMARLPATQVAAIVVAGGHDALSQTYRVFKRASVDWRPATRPFSAMPGDPSLLLADLAAGTDGRIQVPGDAAFWRAVFDAEGNPARLPSKPTATAIGSTTDVPWLLEQVYGNGIIASRARSEQVRFAARILAEHADARPEDAMLAVVALERVPALVLSLDRMGISDPSTYRDAVSRTLALDSIRDPRTQARSTAQFQGALALLVQASRCSAITVADAARLVSALSGIELSDTGEYDGRVSRWMDKELLSAHAETGGVAVDDALLEWASGRAHPGPARPLTWEGTRYRLDLGYAELRRIERVRGERPARDLAGARLLLDIADRIATAGAPKDRRDDLRTFDEVVRTSAEDAEALAQSDDVASLASEVRGRLKDGAGASAAIGLRQLADAFAARGLAELAYATALGGADGRAISSGEASRRHQLDAGRPDATGMPNSWQLPLPAARARGPWHLEGSLLTLDMTLAETWLRRRSERPLSVAPTLDRNDRRALAQVVPLMRAASLADVDLDRIAQAIRRGRDRLASAAPGDLPAIVEPLPLDSFRRGVWEWALGRDLKTAGSLLYLRDLLLLGDRGPWPDAWGAPIRPRASAFRLEFPHHPPDIYMGHLSSGILMGAVADLNLRLAEALATLHMPASLLPGVLAAATVDVVDGTPARYPDDLRSVAGRVESITVDDVEQYLAMLTTDGPLVPEEQSGHTSSGGDR
jgi:hypothetical protein